MLADHQLTAKCSSARRRGRTRPFFSAAMLFPLSGRRRRFGQYCAVRSILGCVWEAIAAWTSELLNDLIANGSPMKPLVVAATAAERWPGPCLVLSAALGSSACACARKANRFGLNELVHKSFRHFAIKSDWEEEIRPLAEPLWKTLRFVPRSLLNKIRAFWTSVARLQNWWLRYLLENWSFPLTLSHNFPWTPQAKSSERRRKRTVFFGTGEAMDLPEYAYPSGAPGQGYQAHTYTIQNILATGQGRRPPLQTCGGMSSQSHSGDDQFSPLYAPSQPHSTGAPGVPFSPPGSTSASKTASYVEVIAGNPSAGSSSSGPGKQLLFVVDLLCTAEWTVASDRLQKSNT